MGILSNVISWLAAEDITAKRAYPSGQMSNITSPVAAVQLQSMTHGETVVLVNVLSPTKSGAGACEDAAIQIGQILCDCGGSCTVGKSSYLAEANVFCVPVKAAFAGTETDGIWTQPQAVSVPTFSVQMGGVTRSGAVSFTAHRAIDETITVLSDAIWYFTLEELFSLDGTEEADPGEPCTIVVSRPGRTETYKNCTLLEQKRVLTSSGLRHIRSGFAESRTVS